MQTTRQTAKTREREERIRGRTRKHGKRRNEGLRGKERKQNKNKQKKTAKGNMKCMH